MPEGIMHCDLRHLGGDSDYFTSDAQAERAAPMIREMRIDWRLDPKKHRNVDRFNRN